MAAGALLAQMACLLVGAWFQHNADPPADDEEGVVMIAGDADDIILRQRSTETAESLRATQTRLDELVARAGEVRVGLADSDTYASDVDDLVVRLEALHQALEETNPG